MSGFLGQQSRYIRNTWLISAENKITFYDNSSVRYFDSAEAKTLSEIVRKRNVFARHSYENNFYLKRINELANHTIIEVFRYGDPQSIREDAEEAANLVEKLILFCAVLEFRKALLLKKLGIHLKHRNELDIILGSKIQYISSRFKGTIAFTGINISQRLKNRFEKCRFSQLYEYCQFRSDLTKRLTSSMDWLFESKLEPLESASFIKTSIALETFLIFADSEPLGRSLSERVAFILSSDPVVRQKLSEIIIRFYKTRSDIVHGNRREPPDELLSESVERLLVLIYLTMSQNKNLWPSVAVLRKWFETQRWGSPSSDVIRSFPEHYLNDAIGICTSSEH